MKKSKIKLSKAPESEIEIKISKKEKKKKKKQLQRTEKWREQRRGNWTGSALKSLMSCGHGKGKLKWDNIDRLFSFGATAIKYIYENAMERKTGRYIDDGDGTYQMRYGTRIEPLILKLTIEELNRMKVKGKVKLVGYKSFPNIPNTGTSSDAKLVNKKGKTIASVEIKACTNWGTHYDRTFNLTDQTSKDFWQVQAQTLAHDVKTCYYAVAEPPSDILKYLFYDGDIMDLYSDFKKECKVTIEVVKSSKLHCDGLIKRITIAEDALNDWLSAKGSLKENLDETIAFYEKEPEKLLQYIPPLPFRDKDNVDYKYIHDKSIELDNYKKIKRPEFPKDRKEKTLKKKKKSK